jgi:tripartite ATP-independent transporter DctM subunit
MVPVIVIGGIVGGLASPTEAATFAVVYGFLVSLLIYRSITLATGYRALRDATMIAGMVLFMICGANVLSSAIVTDGLARSLGAAFVELNSPLQFMLLSMVTMIVVGIVLEGLPALLIGAPILLPIATKFGVDPLQFGIMITMATGIGVFLPPVGIGYYVACAIGDAPVHATMRPSIIYNVFLVLGLAVVILVPGLTVWLPHYFGMH